MRKLVTSLSLLIAVAPMATAHAGQCGRLSLDDHAQDVVIGQAGIVSCFWFWGRSAWPPFRRCVLFPPLRREMGVCWRGSDGVWRLEDRTGCTASSLGTDYFWLETKGGDDRVTVLKAEHADYMPCGGGGGAIAPWPASFDFYIHASLGTGSDLFHGSPNGDEVQTNGVTATIERFPVWPFLVRYVVLDSLADHSSPDLACGWGGNDLLYGDKDDDRMNGEDDWLDGGPGNDRCDGDWSLGGSRSGTEMGDLWRNCEAQWDASPDERNLIDCGATDDPLHEWSDR